MPNPWPPKSRRRLIEAGSGRRPDEPKPDPLADDTFWTPEAVIGYKGWQWDPSRKRLSAQYSYWPTRTLVAEHLDQGGHGSNVHKPPQPGCRCGVNAYVSTKLLEARNYPILGRLALYGEVIEFGDDGSGAVWGYRAARGEILQLAVWEDFEIGPPDLVPMLESIYGVPTRRIDLIPWREVNGVNVDELYGGESGNR